MKKYISCMIVVLLVLSMAACASSQGQQLQTPVNPAPAPAATSTTGGTAPETTVASEPTESPETTAVPETEPVTVPTEPETPAVESLYGTTEGNVYVSEYLGLTFDAGSDMRLLSEEEIQLTYGTAMQLQDKEAAEFAEGNIIMDMIAVNDTTGDNVIVQIMNNSLVALSYNIQRDTFLDGMLEGNIESLTNMGATDVTGEFEQAVLCGKSCDVVVVKGNYIGLNYNMETYVYSDGAYVICIAFTTLLGGDPETMVSRFQPV